MLIHNVTGKLFCEHLGRMISLTNGAKGHSWLNIILMWWSMVERPSWFGLASLPQGLVHQSLSSRGKVIPQFIKTVWSTFCEENVFFFTTVCEWITSIHPYPFSALMACCRAGIFYLKFFLCFGFLEGFGWSVGARVRVTGLLSTYWLAWLLFYQCSKLKPWVLCWLVRFTTSLNKAIRPTNMLIWALWLWL